MATLLQINTTVNTGSTGRIAEAIGQHAIANGWNSYIAYGRTGRESASNTIKIGSKLDINLHGIETLLFDNHGFASTWATNKFVDKIGSINPDVILLHNLHGYYINVEVLFNYLSKIGKPIFWTLHDCWPFTGHCTYFDAVNCDKWQSECVDCNHYHAYPKAIIDRTTRNWHKRQEIFTRVKDLTFIPVCHWMQNIQQHSFLRKFPSTVIYNGVDLDVFKPVSREQRQMLRAQFNIFNHKIILGVASTWDARKGLEDFKWLSHHIPDDYKIILVGLNNKQIKGLQSNNIIGIKRTENIHQLASLYSIADVFVNPTYVDNFPTTNIEALACGTPVITYNTGGSPEAIDQLSGLIINKGDKEQLLTEVIRVVNTKLFSSKYCRERAISNFDQYCRFDDYIKMFEKKLNI